MEAAGIGAQGRSGDGGSGGSRFGSGRSGGEPAPNSHWMRWHAGYEDPDSRLSLRLALVQAAIREVFDSQPPGGIRVLSLCAGQGRDVIDVVARHPRGVDVQALLVEQDPSLVAFARARAAAEGVSDRVRVVEADAALARHWMGRRRGTRSDGDLEADTHNEASAHGGADAVPADLDAVPADLVVICGIFGNISRDDIAATIAALPSFCVPGASVIWTRHRRPPDQTPVIRALFTQAGFVEASFADPDGSVLSVGRHRLVVPPTPFDPDLRLFEFTGDGGQPA